MTAIVAAVAAAICYGAGAALQQRQAASASDRSAARLMPLALLVRCRWWLLGIAAELAGFGVHAIALHAGPLVVVQIISACSVIVSVGLASWWARRPLGWPGWAAILAVVTGTGTLLDLVTSGSRAAAAPGHLELAAIITGLTAALLAAAGLASRGSGRVVMLAVAAGVADAAVAVVTTAFSAAAGHGLAAVATSWSTYALMTGGPAALLLTQGAYQTARPVLTLPIIAVVNPLVSVATGIVILGQSFRADGMHAPLLTVAAVAIAAGLISLARLAGTRSAAPAATGPHGASGKASEHVHGGPQRRREAGRDFISVRGYATADHTITLTVDPGQADSLASLIAMLTAATGDEHQVLAGAIRPRRQRDLDGSGMLRGPGGCCLVQRGTEFCSRNQPPQITRLKGPVDPGQGAGAGS